MSKDAEPVNAVQDEQTRGVSHAEVVPLIDNLITPHVWKDGVCLRCGAEFGNKDSCP